MIKLIKDRLQKLGVNHYRYSIITIIGVILTATLSYNVLLKPLYTQYNTLKRNITTTRQKIIHSSQSLILCEKLTRLIETDPLALKIIEYQQTNTPLLALSHLANLSQLNHTKISPENNNTRFKMNSEGKYSAILQFIHELTLNPMAVRITRLSLKRKHNNSIHLSLELSTHVN